ncbi:hypothetical protein B0H10DRAFT_1800814, partial [Mycena sp. CBHHK59/15]
WIDGVNVATALGDCCTMGSWAIFQVHNLPMIARVFKILLPKGSKSAKGILVVAKYDVGEALHPHYHMPILLPDAATSRVVFSFNAQHDCRAMSVLCQSNAMNPRSWHLPAVSNTIIHSIMHKDDTRFIINMHGFHNARLLRKYLPVALTKP